MNSKKSAGVQEWPWLAAFYHPENYQEGSEQQFCGGAIITDNHILSAAHCFQGFEPFILNMFFELVGFN